jgi:acetoin utilization protein AcuB
MSHTGVNGVGRRRQAARNASTAGTGLPGILPVGVPELGNTVGIGQHRHDSIAPLAMTAAPVATWMSSPVHTVAPRTLVADAVTLLRRHGIRHLPVLEGDRIVGVVTDRDLRGAAPGTPVEAVMSRPVTVVAPRSGIDRAARLLFDQRIGCLPVVEDGRLVGILTQTDAVAALVAIVRLQVGGRHAQVAVAYRPDAMALAQLALRGCGPEVARLVTAVREPLAPGQAPARVRLEVETREMPRVLDALRAAGLSVLGEPVEDRG